MKYYSFLLISSFLLLHCQLSTDPSSNDIDTTIRYSSSDDKSNEVKDKIRSMGDQIIHQLEQRLTTRLVRKLRQESIKEAIRMCRVKPLPLIDTLSQRAQLTIRRVTHRPRNPDNRANPQEKKLIQQYIERQKTGNQFTPVIRSADTNQQYTYFAPIVIQKRLCLNCHGHINKEINPEHDKLIKKAYPNDSATGFQMNDIRGLWRIDFQSPSNL